MPVDERHDVERDPVDLTSIDETEDVRVLQIRRRRDLDEEPIGADDRGQLGMEYFDGDAPAVPDVLRQIHRRHPTAPELALDRIAVGEPGAEHAFQSRLGIQVDHSGGGCATLASP